MKENERAFGSLFGLKLTVIPPFVLGSLGIFSILEVIALVFVKMHFADALAFGALGVLTHWLGDVFHNFGHAIAARSTGHPMQGMRFGVYGIFAGAIYPPDEPALPGPIHVRRALGGPILSALIGLLLLWLALRPGASAHSVLYSVLLFALIEHFAVFSFGALLPLPFNDGGTLKTWLGKP